MIKNISQITRQADKEFDEITNGVDIPNSSAYRQTYQTAFTAGYLAGINDYAFKEKQEPEKKVLDKHK